MQESELIRLLVAEQRRLVLSDRGFAQRLGISQALWSNTRVGKARVGRKLLRAVLREFPTLTNEVLKNLAAA